MAEKPPIAEQLTIIAQCIEAGCSYPAWFGNPNALNRQPWIDLLRAAAAELALASYGQEELEQMKKLNGKLMHTLYGD